MLALKLAYPLSAAMLMAFSVWVIALIGWKPNRMWTAAAGGLALAIGIGVLRLAGGARRLRGRLVLDSDVARCRLDTGLRRLAASRRRAARQARGSRRLSATSIAAAAALCILVVGQFLSVGARPSRLRRRRWSP